MMDDKDRQVVSALQGAQVAENRGHLARLVFVHLMQADKGVENKQTRRLTAHGFGEAMLISQQIQAHRGCGDDVDGQRVQVQTAMATKAEEPSFHQRRRIFGHVQQHAPGVTHGKRVETRRAAGHRHGHIQAHPTLTAFRQAANRSYAAMDPERLNEPAACGVELVEIGGAHHGQCFPLAGAHASTT